LWARIIEEEVEEACDEAVGIGSSGGDADAIGDGCGYDAWLDEVQVVQ